MNLDKRLLELENRHGQEQESPQPIVIEVIAPSGMPETEVSSAVVNYQTYHRNDDETEQAFRDRIHTDILMPLIKITTHPSVKSVPTVLFMRDSKSKV